MDASTSSSSSSSFQERDPKKTRVLLVGPMTTLARCVAEASMESGYHTVILLHPGYPSQDPAVNAMIANLFEKRSRLFSLFPGRIDFPGTLEQAISESDVIISTAGGDLMENHLNAIITAMKESLNSQGRTEKRDKLVQAISDADAGGELMENHLNTIITTMKELPNYERLIPLGLLIDVDRMTDLQPGDAGIERCRSIRRRIEESGVRYTFIVTNFIAEQFFGRLNNEIQPPSVPLKIPLYGDGTAKVSFSFEKDAARYIVKAAVDFATVRKTVYIRHPQNVVSLNEILAMWENKIEGQCERPPYIQEEELLSRYRAATDQNVKTVLAYMHSAFVMGDQTNFRVDPEFSVEASQTYRDIEFTKINDYLSKLAKY